ncbi:MAG: 30S ribosomal protein S2 [Minisyncoccales bacterium]
MNLPSDFLTIEEMQENNLQKGRIISKTNPKMRPFIGGVKTPFYLFNLEKTKEYFEKALLFLKTFYQERKKILVVETRPPFQELVKDFAQRLSLPYINFRFLGGTFTNFEVIKQRVEFFKKMEEEKNSQVWNKYTKKERALLEKKLEKLRKKFEGLKNLDSLPDVLFVLNTEKDILAIQEARRKKIKIVAVCDTNADPSLVDYPIPCSNNSLLALKYLLNKVQSFLKPEEEIKKDREKNDREN